MCWSGRWAGGCADAALCRSGLRLRGCPRLRKKAYALAGVGAWVMLLLATFFFGGGMSECTGAGLAASGE